MTLTGQERIYAIRGAIRPPTAVDPFLQILPRA